MKRTFKSKKLQLDVQIEIVPHGEKGQNPLNPYCSMPAPERQRLLIEALADIWARYCREAKRKLMDQVNFSEPRLPS